MHRVLAFACLVGFGLPTGLMAACGSGDLHVSYHTKYASGATAVNYATRRWAVAAWTIETLETGDSTLIPRSNLALDKDSQPHVSYAIQGTNGLVKHAWKSAGDSCSRKETAFQSSPMMPMQKVGEGNSVALDANGRVTIAYSLQQSGQAYLAHDDRTGTWAHAQVAAPVMNNAPVSQTWVSYAPANEARLTFLGSQPVTFSLNYMAGWGGSSVVEKDVTGNCYGNYGATSVTDKLGFAHTAYYCWQYQMPSKCFLKYATNASGAWVTQTVATVNSIAMMGRNACTDPLVAANVPVAALVASVMVDSQNRPAIAFTAPVEKKVLYAKSTDGWTTTELVDNNGWFASLMFDTADAPAVTYWDGAASARFAYRLPTGWRLETIDANGVDEVGTLGISGVRGRSFWP